MTTLRPIVGSSSSHPGPNPAQDQIVTDSPVNDRDGWSTATSLLARAAVRQPDAWDRMVSLYGPLVYRWCRRWGLQACDAENVGQEVFVRVASGLGDFHRDRSGDSFRGWLYRIARNCYVDHLRARDQAATGKGGSSTHEWIQQTPAPSPNYEEDPQLAGEDEVLLYRHVVEFIRGEFSERDWTAFCRVVVDGISPAAAAEELQVSVNVVYLARSRVLRRVREEFAGLMREEN